MGDDGVTRLASVAVEAGAGRRVIVTRPADQAGPWVQSLQEQGIPAVAVPLIGIAPAADRAAVGAVWSSLADHDLLVFVSPNAAAQFFACRPDRAAWPATVTAASPGPGTSAALRGFGIADAQLIEPAADAPQFDSESLWAQLRLRPWRGARVLIVRGDGGREWLADQLHAAGADVAFLAAYQRGPAELSAEARRTVLQALAEPERHVWFFSSSEAVDHLLAAGLLSPEALPPALQASTALATHPRIAGRARAAGFATVLDCRPSLDAVVACLQSQRLPNLPGAPRPAP